MNFPLLTSTPFFSSFILCSEPERNGFKSKKSLLNEEAEVSLLGQEFEAMVKNLIILSYQVQLKGPRWGILFLSNNIYPDQENSRNTKTSKKLMNWRSPRQCCNYKSKDSPTARVLNSSRAMGQMWVAEVDQDWPLVLHGAPMVPHSTYTQHTPASDRVKKYSPQLKRMNGTKRRDSAALAIHQVPLQAYWPPIYWPNNKSNRESFSMCCQNKTHMTPLPPTSIPKRKPAVICSTSPYMENALWALKI